MTKLYAMIKENEEPVASMEGKEYELPEVVTEVESVCEEEVMEEVVEIPKEYVVEITEEDRLKSIAKISSPYFTLNKGKTKFYINGTALEPNKLTLSSGKKFKQNYRIQLNKLLFEKGDNLNVEKLIELTVLWSYISDGVFPIQIKSSGYTKKLPEIILVMNSFYRDNRSIMSGIYKMVQDHLEMEDFKKEVNDA